MDAATFVHVIESRQGFKIGSPEEVAYREGYITSRQLEELTQPLVKSGYGQYLKQVLENG